MQTGHNEHVSRVFVFVDELMKKLRKMKKDIHETSQLLAQYCLQESLEVPDTWTLLLALQTIADLPASTRKRISETFARLNAWAMNSEQRGEE